MSDVAEKQPKVSKRGGARAGSGRPKGSLDKGNALIRDMIIEALHNVGGVAYLEGVARDQPTAFVSLIGKVMPVQVEGTDNPVLHSVKVTFG